MDTAEGSNTFIKVDGVNESSGRVENLDLPQQQLSGDESWLDQEDAQELDPEEEKQSVTRIQIRPPLRKDQWAPAPEQPPPPAPPSAPGEGEGPMDSLSLMQLKKIVKDMPAKEPTPYDFRYSDSSSFGNEVEELFGYSIEERRLLVQLPSAFQRAWQDYEDDDLDDSSHDRTHRGWRDCDDQDRRAFLTELKSGITLANDVQRLANVQALAYIALGCWMDLSGHQENPEAAEHTVQEDSTVGCGLSESSDRPKQSLHLVEIEKNVVLLEDVVGTRLIFGAFRGAYSRARDRQNEYSSQAEQGSPSLSELDAELWSCLLLMYLLVDQAWRQNRITSKPRAASSELYDIKVDLLRFLSRTLADMRWEESGASPPVKLLSLYWKTILLAFGGIQEVTMLKDTLEQADTPEDKDDKPYITASPLDYHFFRQEITSKYPAINPPQPLFPFEPESTSFIPPLQEHVSKSSTSNGNALSGPASISGTASSIFHQPVHISTPAPSPPPSPAGPGAKGVKKQNYQTNQMFPFLYPPLEQSSNDIGGKGSTEIQDALVGRKWAGSDIPTSILEAADLFAKRMRATRAMKQLWEERVRFMKFERGYDSQSFTQTSESRKDSSESGSDSSEKESMEGHGSAADKLDESSRRRLHNVEQFYAAEVPQLQSIVIVLLKVLLQTVTTLVTQPNLPNGLQNGFQSPDNGSQNLNSVNGESQETEQKTPTLLQNLDTVRSQEIMCKAVSGILLLLMKWFRISHVLKFEYLSQLLLDSNYVQLILKLFTHQELERVVNFKCERSSLNFFNLCQSQVRGVDILTLDGDEGHDTDEAVPPPVPPRRQAVSDPTDDMPVSATRKTAPDPDNPNAESGSAAITDYSWRNFYTAINHLRILQKLVKHKAHRQLMMVQFKYSNILKKSLKVPQPDIRLYTLKIIKGQVPYCHRKWRQSNMRIITAIYLHCKPELRDDWLAGLALEEEMSEALPLEQALRSLTYWHNLRRYPEAMGQDRDKARDLLEVEQDFFTRELDAMEAGMDRGTDEGDEAEDDPQAGGMPPGIPVQMDAW